MTGSSLNTFPVGYEYVNFVNWSKEISGNHILTCYPQNTDELLAVINWAHENKYCVRPVGIKHNWSPLVIANGEDNSNVVLIDLTRKFKNISINKVGEHGYVTAQTGVTMQALLTELEKKKLGFYATPAPGDLTLGGVLAIGGHGTCVPAKDEPLAEFASFGSVSNSVVSLKAVVWDQAQSKYELKEFTRDNAESSAFLVHVGRAFISEVTLQVPRNRRLRCQSYVNVTAADLFSTASTTKNTFSHFLDLCGRVEVIWFPFTEKPWLKVWKQEDSFPKVSKPVNGPFNYPFSDNLPVKISDIIKKINNGHPELTPTLGKAQMELVSIGLGATVSADLWGWSKDLLLYVKPTTLRVTANGYAIITKRSNIQNVLHDFTKKYEEMVADYQRKNSFPMNGPIEIRVTGLDSAKESAVANAIAPDLSAIRPVESHPEWDVAIWLDILTMPDTPDANKFYSEMEKWIFSHYAGDYATVRVEWSKGWGYTSQAAWQDKTVLEVNIPRSFNAGAGNNDSWNHACNVLNKYDPHNVFSSPLTKAVFKQKS
ncbi:cholesterol oxidase substrate-binding domain-containing protein [Serratia marcescens]|uniref:cholesterol oxidase substrate-binding domain-containing protein n=1 Tax=Serratia TaxID=613 RepID=UPI0027746B36|nr:cholesterol oxidase substrate-binding domain-containing protein [Serratia marcescens]MDP8774786.1 cholesterol oxidase substrate-binding domain-containing protein [Serratia marcescens]MDP8805196.1 cholesterol oxidase substrate-binding domain-containing protein [Serratia marcescens]